MFEKIQIQMANQYFDRRMKTVFVNRVGVETFEKYLAYRYRDSCYYYSGYAIMGMNDDDYLMRGDLCIRKSFIWRNGGYSHGWVEFKYKNQEYVFDSMCIGVVPKKEWYKEFKPIVKFKHSKKEILESIINGNTKAIDEECLEILNIYGLFSNFFIFSLLNLILLIIILSLKLYNKKWPYKIELCIKTVFLYCLFYRYHFRPIICLSFYSSINNNIGNRIII